MLQTVRRSVVFSVSKPSEDASELLESGWLDQHMDDAVIRLGRAIFRAGYDISYGGEPGRGFTRALLDDTSTVTLEPRFISFVGWPHTESLTPARIADDLGICRYVKVLPPQSLTTLIDAAQAGTDEQVAAWALARSISLTRATIFCLSAKDIESQPVPTRIGQIALGGKLVSFAGRMPGIAEEILLAMRAGLAIYIVGAFGGASQRIAHYLCGKEWPIELVREFHVSDQKFCNYSRGALLAGFPSAPSAGFEQLKSFLERARRCQSLNNGLSWSENHELMSTMDVSKIVQLICKGLSRLAVA